MRTISVRESRLQHSRENRLRTSLIIVELEVRHETGVSFDVEGRVILALALSDSNVHRRQGFQICSSITDNTLRARFLR